MIKTSMLFLAMVFVSSLAWGQTGQDGMCALLKDQTLPAYTRQVLEARCLGQAEGAVNAKIEDTRGVVRRFHNGQWIVIGTVDGINSNWTISYDKKIFTFVSPDGQHSLTVSTERNR